MALSVDQAAAWMAKAAQLIEADADRLTDLDRQIGDADHGLNVRRGFREVATLDAADYPDAAAYLKKVGMTLVSKVGGASGPLYGTFFLRFAQALTGEGAGVVEALGAGIGGIQARGKAEAGEKTMLEALLPAYEAAQAHAGERMWDAVVAAAERGAEASVDMVATKGRASYLGERSRGTMDPGAASAVLILRAAREAMGA
ncbi:dihydroxyacetone kinase subunit L [Nanchangia anserum]|uniref:Dihydroxyacetone kinase subunit L n=1 Tax=Nanchangia anserum TaxID=2692125 RepID=A0A8I0KRI7_9ACTO|nr:dihydroxyacetone kinase subunit DhaL [Nanchangia anserum]MBD3689452.1 dihydroxyacetone kinase subunit L [Nanchangia anserum]QOX81651.1 dihydroxyacetone kinase subunit L [Nanchangia anserum]